ncbi:hypothetical protein DEO72_LG7g1314 [Vigna unguiculata]|uniref:Uncharacterized protein n=1 Tax=Vigna unguiculata TaxID=3917 RepID=A0A4D6MG87_VIGUN|nr:hypothetical protein DEO72_LG7g1314 [Vigna unguiculata]
MSPHHSLSPSHNQNPNPNLLLPLHHSSAAAAAAAAPDVSRHRTSVERPPSRQPPSSRRYRRARCCRHLKPPPRRDCRSRCHYHARGHGCTSFTHELQKQPCVHEHETMAAANCAELRESMAVANCAELPETMAAAPSSSSIITLPETTKVTPSHLVKPFATHTAYTFLNNCRHQPRCRRVAQAPSSMCHRAVRICNNPATLNLQLCLLHRGSSLDSILHEVTITALKM